MFGNGSLELSNRKWPKFSFLKINNFDQGMVMALTFNPNTQEAEAKASGSRGQRGLQSEL